MKPRDTIKFVKPILFFLSLIPIAVLIFHAIMYELGANPVEKVLRATGDWTLNFLLITLSITPLHDITGWSWLARLRRMAGLFSFFYASLHFITYTGIDQEFSLSAILEDVSKHKRIIFGFVSFVILIALAITSTNRMAGRLGYGRWKGLHRLDYLAAISGVIHYLLLVKKDIQRPLIYASILGILLGYRTVAALWRRKELA